MSESEQDDSMPEARNDILFTYSDGKDSVQPAPVNGVYGGPDPGRDFVVLNFFLEQATVPIAMHMPLDEQGFGDQANVKEDKRSHFQRTIVSRIVITPKFANVLANWLLEQANKAGADPQDDSGE